MPSKIFKNGIFLPTYKFQTQYYLRVAYIIPFCRQNLCGITNCLYLKVLLDLLEISKSPLDRTRLGQLREILTDCYQAIQSYHFNQQLFDEDLNIVRLKLLLLCSSHDLFASPTVIGSTELEPVGLLKMCLCGDGHPMALHTFCLEFINTAAAPATFSNDVIAEHVFKSLCSESDPDYLIQVLRWFVVSIPDLLCFTVCMHVASPKAYRFASCPSVIRKKMSDESLSEVFEVLNATLIECIQVHYVCR